MVFWHLFISVPVRAPAGCLASPTDLYKGQSKYHLHDKFPQLISYTKAAKGGHFVAFEEPQVLATDLIQFCNLVEKNSQFVKNNNV